MKMTLAETDRQCLEHLHRLGEASIVELCESIGVTATAVRQRLTRLESVGFVQHELVREGRGRPSHTYMVTDAALRQLGDNYTDLALLLWRELTNLDPPEVRRGIIRRLQASMVRQYGNDIQGETVGDRLKQLKTVLSDRGFDVELDGSDSATLLPVLRENSCPYHELAVDDRSICDLEQSVFEEVLGTSVTLTSCCRDGDHCCEFEVAGTV